MSRSRKCGDNPWMSRWHIRQSKKAPRYFCTNCLKLFRTGRFGRFDDIMYDDICPYCGAPGSDLAELAELYKSEIMKKEEIIKGVTPFITKMIIGLVGSLKNETMEKK